MIEPRISVPFILEFEYESKISDYRNMFLAASWVGGRKYVFL